MEFYPNFDLRPLSKKRVNFYRKKTKGKYEYKITRYISLSAMQRPPNIQKTSERINLQSGSIGLYHN